MKKIIPVLVLLAVLAVVVFFMPQRPSEAESREDRMDAVAAIRNNIEGMQARIAEHTAELDTIKQKQEARCKIKIADFVSKNYEGSDNYDTVYKHQKCLSDTYDELMWSALAKFVSAHDQAVSSGTVTGEAIKVEQTYIQSSGQAVCLNELKAPVLDLKPKCAPYLTPAEDTVENKVAANAVREYFLTLEHGKSVDICVQAGMVAAAFLQAHDDESYEAWVKQREKDCD